MTREQLLEIGLTDEQANRALGLYTEEMKSFVPRARLTEETEKLAALQGQLADRDKDIQALQAAAGKGTELEKQLTELEGKYQADTEALNQQITQTKLDAALDAAILRERGKNPKAIRALLDLDKLQLGEDGEVEGLDLAALKAAEPYLFGNETVSIQGTGRAAGGLGDPSAADPSQMSMSEYRAWRQRQR